MDEEDQDAPVCEAKVEIFSPVKYGALSATMYC
jgi:hypothetical protein